MDTIPTLRRPSVRFQHTLTNKLCQHHHFCATLRVLTFRPAERLIGYTTAVMVKLKCETGKNLFVQLGNFHGAPLKNRLAQSVVPAQLSQSMRIFRLPKFGLVSGIGWFLDASVLLLLVHAGIDVLYANMISAGLAVTFVFIVAQRAIFFSRERNPLRMFLCYLLWQIVAIYLASIAVDLLSTAIGACASWTGGDFAEACTFVSVSEIATALAKVTVTPLTMYANFVFMSWLIEARLSWY